MATLTMEAYVMPSASMGIDNPLPDIHARKDLHASIPIDEETVSPEESKYMGWGRVNGILPYTIQDGYNRIKKPRVWKAAVLRNAYLEATFLPQLGGRLWSLIDRTTGKELLHRNPVFQPCNLALRNAWISGGVEWNVGLIGHTPFTVDDLHAQALTLSDGTPVLRMYQYERVRHLVYRVEALLPEDSRQLIVRVRIDNAGDADTAVYWWSNIAVDEREDVRVLVPADKAFRFGYGGKLAKVDVPHYQGWDISHTTQIPQAVDFFFDIPKGHRRWIAALNPEGYGLFQTSTDVLTGRKLFVWGMGKGGRNWQTFLAEPGCAYLEIQAGLAHTQLEHLPMAGGQTIAWTEAYGALSADGAAVTGEDWGRATQAAEAAMEAALPRADLEAWDKRLAEELDGLQGRTVHRGDGWGYVESQICGEGFRAPGLRFSPRNAGPAEAEWLALLRDGALPCPDPALPPKGYQVNDRWMRVLADSIASGKSDHWYGHYHLGVMQAYRMDFEAAKASFERSLAHARSCWALRCLAVIAKREGNLDQAAEWMLEAMERKTQRQLALEAIRTLVDAKRYDDALRASDALPPRLKRLGRMKVMRAEALLATDRLAQAERLLRGRIELTDVREGEVALTDLWFDLCAKKLAKAQGVAVDDAIRAQAKAECPPPAHLDFRMR